MKKHYLILIILLSLISWHCKSEKPLNEERVVIGVPADAESLNPLYAFGLLEGNIRELLYLGLVGHRWNDSLGSLITYPMLAEKWEWNKDSSSLVFYLRNDLYWSDSTKITTEDVIYTFDLYSDPDVNSTFYGGFENLPADKFQHIKSEEAFELLSATQLKINFKKGAAASLFDVDMPILPKHYFSKFERKNLSRTSIEHGLVTSGPYTLLNWKRNEAIFLQAAQNSYLYSNNMIKQLVFKVVPDEKSRLLQLKKGELDLVEDINTESVSEIEKDRKLRIVSRTGRDYDFIGWNNIDPIIFSKGGKIKPNKFFGSVNVRKAMSYAIKKGEILSQHLKGFGKLCFSPVSPIFIKYYNYDIKPYEYNPSKARELLKSDGWKDVDQNGVLEKDGVEFSFKLYIGAGNPRRSYTATIVKNNLKAIGINVQIETMEMSSFFNKVLNRELDAYIAGWTIPIPLDLQPYWHSDFNKSPLNLSGFSSSDVDEILGRLEKEKSEENKIGYYKKLQQLLHDNEPVTFLYWLDIITAYNSKITNVNINPLGAIQHCWEWRLKQ